MKEKSFVELLCDILASEKAITIEQRDSLISAFKGKSRLEFENFLLQEGFVARNELLDALAMVYAVPAFDASGYFFEHRLVTTIPKELLVSAGFIPLSVEDDAILLVVASVPNDERISEICALYTPWDVRALVGLNQDIVDAIEEYYDDALTISDDGQMLLQQERDERETAEKLQEELERHDRTDLRDE